MSEDKTFADPKDLFLFNLNKNIEQIYQTLTTGKVTDGANQMCVFIQRLDVPEEYTIMFGIQKQWLPQDGYCSKIFHKTATNSANPYNDQDMTESEIWYVWRELCKFMNATYFKGWNGTKPAEKQPKGKL